MTTEKTVSPYHIEKADFDKLVKSIATAGTKLDKEIQRAALHAIYATETTGNTFYVNDLYLALSAGTRKTALAAWFTKYGKVTINMDSATHKAKPFLYDKLGTTDMVTAAAKLWTAEKPEQPIIDTFDIKAALSSLLKRAAKSEKVTDPAMLAALTATLGA